MTGILPVESTLVSGVSGEIQVPPGFTLAGIEFPALDGENFTIFHSTSLGGTYKELKDPLGLYTATAGDAITFSLGSDSSGIFTIPPALSALLYSYIKIETDSEDDNDGISVIFKQID